MNGEKIVREANVTCNEYQNSKINRILLSNITLKNDHSKIIAFLKVKEDEKSLIKRLVHSKEKICLQDLLGKCDAKCLVIGSSNQSFNTYKKYPNKGECDIVMIDSETFKNNDCDAIELSKIGEGEEADSVIISKEISTGTNLNDFVKKCFE